MINKYVKYKLDQVGLGFCLAKWTTSTFHLAIGKNHSCHHPSPQVIPLEEIKKNSSALHDSDYKKEQRKIMLTGGRPEECSYCWNVEDQSSYYSDRVVTSSKLNFIKDYKAIKQSAWDAPSKLRMLEVSFSNVCNLACAYCGPQYSSKWTGEILSKGPYTESGNYNAIVVNQYLDKEDNPYIDAFWKYLPTVYKDLKTLRITGGEPLLSRHTDKLLEYIIQNPNKNMELVINTNLSVDQKILDEFLNKIKLIKACIKKIKIATSGESTGYKSEYIRDGLVYHNWLNNCKMLLDTKMISLQIMSAYNVFSISSFTNFLKDVYQLKKKYKKVTLSVSYVRSPNFLSAHVAPIEYRFYLEESLEFIDRYFAGDAAKRFEQVLSYFDNSTRNLEDLTNLKNFIKEYDKRRNKNFSVIFPEYKFL